MKTITSNDLEIVGFDQADVKLISEVLNNNFFQNTRLPKTPIKRLFNSEGISGQARPYDRFVHLSKEDCVDLGQEKIAYVYIHESCHRIMFDNDKVLVDRGHDSLFFIMQGVVAKRGGIDGELWFDNYNKHETTDTQGWLIDMVNHYYYKFPSLNAEELMFQILKPIKKPNKFLKFFTEGFLP